MPFCAGGGWKGHDILTWEKMIYTVFTNRVINIKADSTNSSNIHTQRKQTALRDASIINVTSDQRNSLYYKCDVAQLSRLLECVFLVSERSEREGK